MASNIRSGAQKNWVWLNGSLVPEDRAQISLFDRGYLYGDGLFETLRAYNGKVFRLERHLARLTEGAHIIGIPFAISLSQMERIISELLEANEMTDAYLRLTISRGIGVGPLPTASLTPTISLFTRQLMTPNLSEYEAGWKGLLVESALSASAQLVQLKALNYLDKVMAKMKADQAGAKEAILMNSRSEITEAATCNLFVLKGRRILTPPLSAGLLQGITREVIFDLAASQRAQVEEATLVPDDIFTADECFLTNSIIEIISLTELNGKWIGDGRRGMMTASLQHAYKELVKRELGI